MPAIPLPSALAGRIRLSSLHGWQRLDDGKRLGRLRGNDSSNQNGEMIELS